MLEAPQEHGELKLQGHAEPKGGRSKLINVPVLRGKVLRLILQGSSIRIVRGGNWFLLSFLHSCLTFLTQPLLLPP